VEGNPINFVDLNGYFPYTDENAANQIRGRLSSTYHVEIPQDYGWGLDNSMGYGQCGKVWYGGAWKHSVVVDQIGANPCNESDVFVAAHSENRKTWPLSNYSAYQLYPVEIKGYLAEIHLSFMPLVANSGEGTGFLMQSPYPAPGDTFQQPALTSSSPYPTP
jgi:hypothetical protein